MFFKILALLSGKFLLLGKNKHLSILQFLKLVNYLLFIHLNVEDFVNRIKFCRSLFCFIYNNLEFIMSELIEMI